MTAAVLIRFDLSRINKITEMTTIQTILKSNRRFLVFAETDPLSGMYVYRIAVDFQYRDLLKNGFKHVSTLRGESFFCDILSNSDVTELKELVSSRVLRPLFNNKDGTVYGHVDKRYRIPPIWDVVPGYAKMTGRANRM